MNQISVIIPVLNEEVLIKSAISSLKKINPLEVIVVDGGSIDNTVEIARNLGAKVIITEKGRGKQLSEGVKHAKGDIILMLHADCRLSLNIEPSDFNLENGEVAGFFRLKYERGNIFTKLVEIFANIRSRIHSLPYGDQAIFVRKDVLSVIGGIREIVFLEDLDLILRLRKAGKIKFINKDVIVSPRKLLRGGIFNPVIHSVKNAIIAILFMFGLSVDKLEKWMKKGL